METGHILGPFDLLLCPTFDAQVWVLYLNMIGLVNYLSPVSPPGLSINDFIDPNSYSLSYCSTDDPCTIINELGTGALLCF